jgi:predicted RNA-binding Zn ribbon-like protein
MLLLPIAHAMAELICAVDFSDVHICEGPGCGFFFLDKTSERTRRWCSVAACYRSKLSSAV